MGFIIKATNPSKQVFYVGLNGLLSNRALAFEYYNKQGAINSTRYWYGTNEVHWESERLAREAKRNKYRGWKFEVEEY